uniref:Uncharacterized protein n=1 Tax=Tetranychus urticae TaxID=32264 RepID=T1JT23_TETUR
MLDLNAFGCMVSRCEVGQLSVLQNLHPITVSSHGLLDIYNGFANFQSQPLIPTIQIHLSNEPKPISSSAMNKHELLLLRIGIL